MAGEGAVVAAAAGDGADRRMVHRVGRPRRRAGVAVTALECPGRKMRRRGQTGCRGAVVARRTGGSDTGVVERHARKETHRILVASLAGLNGGKMICCFS